MFLALMPSAGQFGKPGIRLALRANYSIILQK
jgi:hypothetical protein